MADSTSWLTALTSGQAAKETTANGIWDAMSPPANFARRAAGVTALTWAYFGGIIYLNGARTKINNGTIALTASTTNYIETDIAGTVSKNTTAFTPGRIPLYKITTGTATITSYEDWRPYPLALQTEGLASVSMASDANKTLLYAEAQPRIIEVTSSVSLTATRNIVVPITKGMTWAVFNNTTGAQALQFIGATGTGITVANAKRAMLYADGTNIARLTADV